MVRTQIYLPIEYQEELAIMAREQGVPKAVIIRKIIKKSLKGKHIHPATGSSLLSLSKLGFTGGPKDLSSKMDEYLYGGK